MDTSSAREEVGPIVLALLDFLVDPLLPSSKSISKENWVPSHEQEELVAKQVHAVALLYNYYHRKQNPELEFLEFESFCKLAVNLKPSLLSYLRHMQREDSAEVDDQEKDLSLTKRYIMNACDICRSLDASHIHPNMEGWPITRVAVFLVDYKKENCFLFHSSVTQGVWSAIEKEIPSQETATGNKKKRIIKKTKDNQTVDEASLQLVAYSAVKEACGIGQADLKTLESHTVYSTSKEKTAVRLYIMQFMQSKEDVNLVPINDALDSLRGPLLGKESGNWVFTPVIEYFHLLPFVDEVSKWHWREMFSNASQDLKSLNEDGHCRSSDEGEKVPSPSHCYKAVKECDNCNSSHSNEEPLLHNSEPFGAVKDHQSKEELLPNVSQPPEAAKEVNGNSCQLKDNIVPSPSRIPDVFTEVINGSTSYLGKEIVSYIPDHSEKVKEVENNYDSRRKDDPTKTVVYTKRNRYNKNSSGKYLSSKTNVTTKEQLRQEEECAMSGSSSNMNIHECLRSCPPVDGKSRSLLCHDHANYQKQMIVSQETGEMALNRGAIVLAEVDKKSSIDHNVEKVDFDDRMSDTEMSEQDGKHDRAIISLDTDFERLHRMQLTIDTKKDELTETALKVLYRKREILSQQLRNMADEIALCDEKIEKISNGAEDDLALKLDCVMEGCNELYLKNSEAEIKDPDLPPATKRKRLSEANLCLHNPCLELDDICNGNSWTVPTYNVFISGGGFKASVSVKGVDFECSSEGSICGTPKEARNSAASNALTKLGRMAVKL